MHLTRATLQNLKSIAQTKCNFLAHSASAWIRRPTTRTAQAVVGHRATKAMATVMTTTTIVAAVMMAATAAHKVSKEELSKRTTAKLALARTRNTKRQDVMARVVSQSMLVMAIAMMSTTIAAVVMMAVTVAPRRPRRSSRLTALFASVCKSRTTQCLRSIRIRHCPQRVYAVLLGNVSWIVHHCTFEDLLI